MKDKTLALLWKFFAWLPWGLLGALVGWAALSYFTKENEGFKDGWWKLALLIALAGVLNLVVKKIRSRIFN